MSAPEPRRRDIHALFAQAERQGRIGIARKTKPVDARPAMIGEVIVTIIAGEGVETRSKPAETGDMIVRNRCPATGHEQYLVKRDAFAGRYRGPRSSPDAEGWREYLPLGRRMQFFLVSDAEGCFAFTASWGEVMVARRDDAIVRSLNEPAGIHRVSAASFACTYEVLVAPGSAGD